MQPLLRAFIALLLAHLLADFPLQSTWITKNKGRHPAALILHGAIHFVLMWICLEFSGYVPFLSILNQLILAGCVGLHLLIDKTKSLLIVRRRLPDNGWTFLTDQIMHLLILTIAALLITRSYPFELWHTIRISPFSRMRILETATIYVGVVFGGGYLIRSITRGPARNVAAEPAAQLGNAGLYIGWLERALIITAMVMQSPALVGLILTGKSIVRFPEFKEVRFAEYFLIGTLLSFSLSVFGGILLLYLLYGSVSLK